MLNTALPSIGPLSHPIPAELTIDMPAVTIGSSPTKLLIYSKFWFTAVMPAAAVHIEVPIDETRLYRRRERRRERYSFQFNVEACGGGGVVIGSEGVDGVLGVMVDVGEAECDDAKRVSVREDGAFLEFRAGGAVEASDGTLNDDVLVAGGVTRLRSEVDVDVEDCGRPV